MILQADSHDVSLVKNIIVPYDGDDDDDDYGKNDHGTILKKLIALLHPTVCVELMWSRRHGDTT